MRDRSNLNYYICDEAKGSKMFVTVGCLIYSDAKLHQSDYVQAIQLFRYVLGVNFNTYKSISAAFSNTIIYLTHISTLLKLSELMKPLQLEKVTIPDPDIFYL